MAAKKTPDRMWTRREMDRAESLRLDGQSMSAIALALGRSLNSVRACLQRLRVRAPDTSLRWLDVLCDEAPDAVTAQQMGCATGTVRTRRSKVRALGYDLPDRRKLAWRRGKREA